MGIVYMLVLATLVAACGSRNISDAMGAQFAANGTVDLRTAAPGDWEHVCVLGPYSTDQAAHATLGFPWPAEARSSIARSDAISLLLFVRDREVVHAVEHARGAGDFAASSGRCFARSRAVFALAGGRGSRTRLVPERSN